MKKNRQTNSFIVSILTLGMIIGGLLLGCGKLSNDTDRPTDPIGSTGGSPLPVGPQASIGTYTLTLRVDPNVIFADMTNYAVIQAQLQDTSGRSVQNFTVNFQTSANFGWFYDTNSGLFISSDSSMTDSTGVATTRFYGSRSGEAVIQASVDIDGDFIDDLTTTTGIVLRSGGQPSTAGNYKLTLEAYPDTIPADMATYSVISAKLIDSTGGSVENFTITFRSELGYLVNTPTGPASQTTSLTSVTNEGGGASVYFYGARAGSAVITASVYVNDLVGTLQAKKVIHITEGPGAPGDENIPGVDLVVDQSGQTVDLGTCTDITPQTASFTFTATVWDETGSRVGAGVRVELSGSGIDNDLNYIGETNSNGSVELTYNYGVSTPGSYTLSATARVVINGVAYTDTVSYTITATCEPEEPPEVNIEAIASPTTIEAGEASTITVLVTTEDGAVVGETVTFYTNLGSISPTSAVTNSSGVAETTFTAGTTPGTATIYITAGSANTTLEITITDAPASITASAPNISSTFAAPSVSTDFTATATVTNASGDLIEGVDVGFSVTPDAACGGNVSFSPTSGSGTTNTAGLAEFSITMTATGTVNCGYTLNVNTGSLTDSDPGNITVN